MNILKNLSKLSILSFAFLATSCAPSPQQAFQNAKLTLVSQIKEHYITEQETLKSIHYGEMQYILLNKTGDDASFPANCYYYTGNITLILADKEPRYINPTTYYNLSQKEGGICDLTIKKFKTLKEFIDIDERYNGNQGSFFPSNY